MDPPIHVNSTAQKNQYWPRSEIRSSATAARRTDKTVSQVGDLWHYLSVGGRRIERGIEERAGGIEPEVRQASERASERASKAARSLLHFWVHPSDRPSVRPSDPGKSDQAAAGTAAAYRTL